MKQTAFDVLIYLFDHFMDAETQEPEMDTDALKGALSEAGFEELPIEKAFDWLEVLADHRDGVSQAAEPATQSFRLYAPEELQRLDAESQGFLLSLEQSGLLDGRSREIVIDRIMALDSEEVDLEQVKWVTLMVLFNQPGQEDHYFWLEELLRDGNFDVQH